VSAAIEPQRTTGSPLGRRNPTVKLALLFLVSVAMLFVFDPVTPAVLYLLALAAVAASARIPARVLLLAHIPFVGFALGLLIVNALSRPGDIIVDVVGLRVTAEGLTIGASLALRTMVIGILSIAFVASTDGVSLMTSLHQQARLGTRLTYAVLAGYRMLQEMPHEWQTIRQAHAVRAPLRPNGRLPSNVPNFGRAGFSLLVVSLRKGERMAQSLESRGLGLRPRTTWRPVPLHRADWLLATAVLAILVLVLTASSALGFLEGFDALFN
jgi:energy-coupling factor transport system permease protein